MPLGISATTHQMPAFVVGGVVRDVLLSRPNDDIDIVLEGDATLFVQELVRSYGGTYEVHPRFGTAKWDLAGSHFGGRTRFVKGFRILWIW
jgi:tRNA nucleotidyltransferase/poly(A) polymerase